MADAAVADAERNFYVYALLRADQVTPFYIGKGKARRSRGHLKPSELNRDTPKSKMARQTIAEIGYVPIVLLAETISETEAFDVEVALIAAFGRSPSGPLLNATDGGHGLCGLSEDALKRARAKIAAHHKGRSLSPEHRAKIAASHLAIREKKSAQMKGRVFTEEHRSRIGDARRGRRHTPEAVEKMRRASTGKSPSIESRLKMSRSRRGRSQSPETRAKISRSVALRNAQLREINGPAICPKCGTAPRSGKGYCRPCHAAYVRDRRTQTRLNKAAETPATAQPLVLIELPPPLD